jgi:hypothetical protein
MQKSIILMKGCMIHMKVNSVLHKIEKEELTAQEAFDLLYPEKPIRPAKYGKRAMFIKMKIVAVDEGKGANTFLRILFALPIPIIFARLGIRFASRFINDDDIDLKEISKLLKYSKNTKIQVESAEAQINIQCI